MISNDNFRILTPEEESQYTFPFCRHCEFYPCELVGECGSVNEIPEIHESQIPILRGRIVATSTEQSKNTEKIYMAKAVSPVHDKYDGDTIADTSHSHSTSPDAHRAIRLSYDQEEFKTDCIMSSLHVCQIECGQKRVSPRKDQSSHKSAAKQRQNDIPAHNCHADGHDRRQQAKKTIIH